MSSSSFVELAGETTQLCVENVFIQGVTEAVFQIGKLVVTNFRVAFLSANKNAVCPMDITIPILMISQEIPVDPHLFEIHTLDCRIVRFSFVRAEPKSRQIVADCIQQIFSRTTTPILSGNPLSIENYFCFVHAKALVSPSSTTHIVAPTTTAAVLVSPSATSSPPLSAAAAHSRQNYSIPIEIREIRAGEAHNSMKDQTIDGWQLFDTLAEFKRQGVHFFDESSTSPPPENLQYYWRLSKINGKFQICDSYPQLLVVPACISDEDIAKQTPFRSKNRIPVLTWFNSRTNTALLRSSQPKTSLWKKSNTSDQKLMDAVVQSNPNNPTNDSANFAKLLIADLRSSVRAEAHRVIGAGYENMSHYKSCRLEFMGIDNLHVMQESFEKLMVTCALTGGMDMQWLSRIEESAWLKHIRLLLKAARYIAECLETTKCSILTHCSDGWDRTSQISSLVQLILDPYFRTILGFAVLIEKDWLHFGHRFHTRTGRFPIKGGNKDQNGPIFLQFMDAVHQLLIQYPRAFEFTEDFLIFIIDNMYSCRFGTFMFDSLAERLAANLPSKTVSIWNYILNNIDSKEISHFRNPFFIAQENVDLLIYPNTNQSSMQFWASYFLRSFFTEEGRFAPLSPFPEIHRAGLDLRASILQTEEEKVVTIRTFQEELSTFRKENEQLKRTQRQNNNNNNNNNGHENENDETDVRNENALLKRQVEELRKRIAQLESALPSPTPV